ncbi:MAG: HupE/UreJ family protein, partial [Pseudomonadota bacterium]
MIRSILRLFTGVIYIVVTAVTMAQAHENKPAIIDLRLTEDRAQVTIVLSLEAIMAGTANHTTSGEGDEAGPYQDLRSLAPEAMREVWLAQEPDFRKGINFSIDGVPIDLIPGPVTVPPVGDPRTARDSVVIYEGPIPNNTGDMAWQTDETYGDTVLRLYFGDAAEPAVADLAFAGATATANLSKVAPKTALGVFTAYIFVGFDHIIPKGLDHILFVVGIFLLAARLGPILWQVTMFTAAHTITLA